MEINKVPEVILNSGKNMPMIGLGTSTSPSPPHEVLTSILVDAIKIGYRHFDTASIYNTEEPLGQAVSKALELGLVKNRDELFVTSKLWCTDAHHDLVLPALKSTLKNLGLGYVDLYLIHWPVRLKQDVEGHNFKGEDTIPFDIKGTWESMEDCYRLGIAKSIGVSNFGIKKLSMLLENAEIAPAVNQVEMNSSWHQGKLREFCKQKGIHVSAWSPLGGYKLSWGSPAVMENLILRKIAEARKKSVAQIALRWIYQQGVIPIVKSFNKERMKQNIEIFDWELNQEELDKINQIPQCRLLKAEMFVSDNGPYKSLEELWDGDP
ncbi:methylecgonone reductase [Medicago truncatula]|uniref:Aldo/keto reductase family oxidoreductase n=2 Tax=Medicago truncatula TaxID=3880 RepID=G7JL33_MEDTR|nr:methylecgonone reductase [Medicago truncatula]XP_024637321.1 methylecgonone reductase [Medicago truncatula]XP_024637322.1 methylecgonone reductase [Medicago truncatula]XP_024637323.1 methylecgonone reductase [Medicago truncatula]AES89308.1 aldo/keto reductase family oxidoreductase [Medicago truncatula]